MKKLLLISLVFLYSCTPQEMMDRLVERYGDSLNYPVDTVTMIEVDSIPYPEYVYDTIFEVDSVLYTEYIYDTITIPEPYPVVDTIYLDSVYIPELTTKLLYSEWIYLSDTTHTVAVASEAVAETRSGMVVTKRDTLIYSEKFEGPKVIDVPDPPDTSDNDPPSIPDDIEVFWSQDFEHVPNVVLTTDSARKYNLFPEPYFVADGWGGMWQNNQNLDRGDLWDHPAGYKMDTMVRVVERDGNKSIRIIQPKDCGGLAGGWAERPDGTWHQTGGGSNFSFSVPPKDEGTYSWDYFWMPGADQARGGKFNGMHTSTWYRDRYSYGGIGPPCDGFTFTIARGHGTRYTDPDGYFKPAYEHGYAFYYQYPSMPVYDDEWNGKCGAESNVGIVSRMHAISDTLGGNDPYGRIRFELGVWQNAAIRIKMNTVHADGSYESDGFVEFFINGAYAAGKYGMVLRKRQTTKIDMAKVYMFYGGNYTKEFAPIEDVWVLMDNFYWYTTNKEGRYHPGDHIPVPGRMQ